MRLSETLGWSPLLASVCSKQQEASSPGSSRGEGLDEQVNAVKAFQRSRKMDGRGT